MEKKLNVTEDTRLSDILSAYPWLPDTLADLDARFKKLRSPLAQALIRRFTVADAAKYAGYPARELMEQLDKLVKARET